MSSMYSIILNFLQNLFLAFCLMAGVYFIVFYASLYALLGII